MQSRADGGFTLLEVLVAMVVLSLAAVGVANLFAIAALSTRAAHGQTLTMLLAADKLEQLRGLTWSFDSNGAPLSDETSDLASQPPGASGRGLRSSPVDALQRNTEGYVDYLDGSGRWVGTGQRPPAGAVFIRRWSVESLPGDAINTLVLQVLVTTVVNRAGGPVESGNPRRPGDALLTSVRTRKGG